MKTIRKVNEILLKAVEFISVLLLVSIAAMLLIQIVSRFFRIGLQWPEEMARFAFVCVVFLGSVVALARNKHIVISTLLDMLPSKVRNLFELIIHLLIALFCGMSIKGILLTIVSAVGVHANSLDWFQYNYVYYSVFASLLLLGIEALLHVAELICEFRESRKEEQRIL